MRPRDQYECQNPRCQQGYMCRDCKEEREQEEMHDRSKERRQERLADRLEKYKERK